MKNKEKYLSKNNQSQKDNSEQFNKDIKEFHKRYPNAKIVKTISKGKKITPTKKEMIKFIKNSPSINNVWNESDFEELHDLTNKALKDIIREIKEEDKYLVN